MNQETQEFIAELKTRPDVLGIILFGSWARGNNRPDSDVDLVVIIQTGFKRTVEYRNKQAFEIIYNTVDGAINFWMTHGDDCAGLWEIAKILYDKDGSVKLLQSEAQKIIQNGKKEIDLFQVEQYKFSAEDEIVAIRALKQTDVATANLVLSKMVLFLTELFFNLRQLWTPAPKQRLTKIQEIMPELHKLLVAFYADDKTLDERIDLAEEIVVSVFKK
jgi:predicted nucleotidyltransferase